MSENIIKTKILLACDTLANWTSVNSTRKLGKGEVALAIDGENIVLRVGKEGGVVFSEAQKLTLESLAAEKVILSGDNTTVQAAIDALSNKVAVEQLSVTLAETFDAKGAAKEVRDELTDISAQLAGDITSLHTELGTVSADLAGDITSLHTELGTVSADLAGSIDDAKAELAGDIGELRTELLGDLTTVSTDLADDITGLHTELTTVSNDLAGDIASVDGKLDTTIVGLSAYEVEVVKLDTAEDGFFATYEIHQGGTKVGESINIPKDFLVKSAEVKEADENTATECGDATLTPGVKYIDFIINTKDDSEQATHIHIKLADLIDKPYKGGITDTITVTIGTDNTISAEVKAKSITAEHIADGVIPVIPTYTVEDTDTIDLTLTGTTFSGIVKLSSITTDHIVDEAVIEAKLATDAVTTAKIADGAVTVEKLAAGVIPTYTVEDTDTIDLELSGTQFKAEVKDNSITAAKLSGEFVFDCGNADVE